MNNPNPNPTPSPNPSPKPKRSVLSQLGSGLMIAVGALGAIAVSNLVQTHIHNNEVREKDKQTQRDRITKDNQRLTELQKKRVNINHSFSVQISAVDYSAKYNSTKLNEYEVSQTRVLIETTIIENGTAGESEKQIDEELPDGSIGEYERCHIEIIDERLFLTENTKEQILDGVPNSSVLETNTRGELTILEGSIEGFTEGADVKAQYTEKALRDVEKAIGDQMKRQLEVIFAHMSVLAAEKQGHTIKIDDVHCNISIEFHTVPNQIFVINKRSISTTSTGKLSMTAHITLSVE